MSSIWSLLQRNVFRRVEERMLEMAFVWKTGRKRKVCILCIVVSAYRPLSLTLVRLKKVDRGQYKRHETWFLHNLRMVDGKDAIQETPYFDLQFDKLYKWTASSCAQKSALLSCLWRLNMRHFSSNIRFINVSQEDLEDLPNQQESKESSLEVMPEDVEEEDDEYQEMTPRESADMLSLMDEYAPLVANAEVFAERLAKDLETLDEANLQCIISSEQQVALVMERLDEALEETEYLEVTLNVYDELLLSVKEQMDDIHEGSSLLQRIDANCQRLTDELLFLVDNLDLAEHHCRILNSADLSSPSKVKDSIAAVEALKSCMSVRLNPEYRKMHGVAEQLITFESLRQNFEKNLVSHVTQMFEPQGADQDPTLLVQTGKLLTPSHVPFHQALLLYTPLMAWLQDTNALIFNDLLKVYINNLNRVYEREIKTFFEVAKTLLPKLKEGRRFMSEEQREMYPLAGTDIENTDIFRPGGVGKMHPFPGLQGSFDILSASSSSLNRDYQRLNKTVVNEDSSDHDVVAKALDRVLTQLAPMCVAEQDFVTSFFMPSCMESPSMATLDESSSTTRSELSCSMSEESQELESRQQQLVNQWLNDIFSALEPELRTFVNACSKINTFSCLPILATLNNHSLRAKKTFDASSSSFLLSVLRNILLLAQHNFDKRISSMCKEIEESKVPSGKRIGVLPTITRFQEFVTEAENVFKDAEVRTELDRAYVRLMSAVFVNINSLPYASLQVNANMVMMENYHHLFCYLSEKKIHSLEAKRSESEQKYSEHLDHYVIRYLGRPLEKLTCFFDGVKARLAQGVKDEEVNFQLAYSKQELRKTIDKYAGKDVRRSLESLYRKILKYLSPEEHLLPVVWHAMEQELLRQYNEFEDLIRRCYPGSEISMHFSKEDLLNYFSMISKANV